MNVDQLEIRRSRIRLPVLQLAREAGRDEHTVHRMLKRKNSPVLETFADVCAAIEREERALLAHLLTLYPAPAGDQAHA